MHVVCWFTRILETERQFSCTSWHIPFPNRVTDVSFLELIPLFLIEILKYSPDFKNLLYFLIPIMLR